MTKSSEDAKNGLADEGEENKVLKVHTKGYMLYDRLIRPVNVIVSGHPKKEEDDKKEENSAQKFDA